MENSFRYFENHECKYYPCHEGLTELNCLFCYCPLYHMDKCPGEYEYLMRDGKQIKSCMNCTYPHKAENFGEIIKLLE